MAGATIGREIGLKLGNIRATCKGASVDDLADCGKQLGPNRVVLSFEIKKRDLYLVGFHRGLFLEDARRIADHSGAWRHVLGDDTPGSNHGALANCDSTENRCVGSD